jgi:asparagine synthase (glutamine-hydrolysing)
MCGISGIFALNDARPVDTALLKAMNDAISHRGPDDDGFHVEPGVGLGHRRLSIIDLHTGHQPLYNEDESVVVVFNGEIYNFMELRDELIAAGHAFHTKTDTEVIVHGWEQWGRDCVKRFRGMFAFALWDRRRGELFLARDRLGKKPLYYSLLPDGMLLFASELKALLRHPGVGRHVDPLAVEDYFALGYVADPRCIFSSVKKLPAASTLVVARGRPAPAPVAYWDVTFARPAAMDEEETLSELDHRLEEAVRMRMVADVPVGAFLSGGVDSSGVVAMMARSSASPVNTCSISFGDPAFNESAQAEKVARALGTRHFAEQVDPDDFSLVDRLAGIYDEPFADSSALPTYRVCEVARRHVKVALSGDGGDEIFAGYRRYRWHLREERLRNLLPFALRRPLFGFLGTAYPKADWAPRFLRAKTTLQSLARSSIEAYFDSIAVSRSGDRGLLFSRSQRGDLQGYSALEIFRHYEREMQGVHRLSQIQYIDIKTYLVGDILTKVDRASMAHGLEVRVPILDYDFVDWAATIPASLKMKNGESKYLLKKVVARHVPPEVVYRPKMGFAVPVGKWFRAELRQVLRDRLLGGALGGTGRFEMDYVRRLVDQHQSGLRDHSALLWSLLLFESFTRNAAAAAAADARAA